MWIQISSGRGPAECMLGVTKFHQYLVEYCKSNNIIVNTLDHTDGDYRHTFKSVLCSVENSVKIKKFEGVIKWIYPSPYRSSHKRKNWFFVVTFYHEPKSDEINMSAVKVETMRSSGAGGQHVNKVESAVRVTHIPTGLSATAREERSQHLNKKLALARLLERIKAKHAEKVSNKRQELWSQHNNLERGNPNLIFKGKSFELK